MSHPPLPARNPVLLVHGIDDRQAVFNRMMAYLKERGWSAHGIDLVPNDGSAGLPQLAQQIADYADRTFGSQPFDLVGFSMGGLVSRYYLQRLGGVKRVQRFVALSAPHYGSWLAHFRRNPGCAQMQPGSPFIQDLHRDVDILSTIQVTCLWTPLDLMIVPATSSALPVGTHRPLPVLGHAWMLTDPQSLAAVAAALSRPLT